MMEIDDPGSNINVTTQLSPIQSISTPTIKSPITRLRSVKLPLSNSSVIYCVHSNNNKVSSIDIGTGIVKELNEISHSGISDLRILPGNCTSSLIGTSSYITGDIKVWDNKTNKPVFHLTTSATNGDGTHKPILTFCPNPTLPIIAAGTELIPNPNKSSADLDLLDKDDAFIVFWDLRQTKSPMSSIAPFGSYWNSHSDDIMCLDFCSSNPTSMVSGSTDGLVNVFNLNETKEDDALIRTWNSESSIDKVSFLNESESVIIGTTHTHDMIVWELKDDESDDIYTIFSRDAIGTKVLHLENGESLSILDYFITNSGRILVACTDQNTSSTNILNLHKKKSGKWKLKIEKSLDTNGFNAASSVWIEDTNQWILLSENGKKIQVY